MKEIITIGVIGHRNAVITDSTQQQIQQFFEDLWQAKQCPIILLSPLAIGADTVVAEIFLTQKIKTGRDYRLHVPIPMSIDKYQTTFSSQDFAYFQQLCEKADKVFTVPTVTEMKQCEQFRQGAKYIIENSQQTIVLWDGNPYGAIGGTADSVFYLQNGGYRDAKNSSSQTDITWIKPLIIRCPRAK